MCCVGYAAEDARGTRGRTRRGHGDLEAPLRADSEVVSG
jgi:hypothetical protein